MTHNPGRALEDCGGAQKTFIERLNHVTGEREWAVADEDYDLIQEVARSRFGDMILDYDRNDRYEAALVKVITEKKAMGDYVHVLDIGTGTGLLSLMAARAGADQVTALEVFTPMAECARRIIAASPYADKITVVATRSTDLSHLGEKPNIIVAEVFDTELIGEGALRTFKEALENLVQPGCRVIPSSARFLVQPVESEFLCRFNQVPNHRGEGEGEVEEERIVKLPNADSPSAWEESRVRVLSQASPLSSDCPGNSAVHDVQLSQLLPERDFLPLAEPIVAFEFNFEDAPSIVYDESVVRRVQATRSGRADGVLAWWDVDMDGSGGDNTLTMAPTWGHPDSRWRDHWMQAIYYLPRRFLVSAGDSFPLLCTHDEYSLWFGLDDGSLTSRPFCTCSWHSSLSRTAIYRMGETLRDEGLRKAIQEACSSVSTVPSTSSSEKGDEAGASSSSSHVVVLGEGSLIGVMAAAFAATVTIVSPTANYRRMIHKYLRHYGPRLGNVRLVASTAEIEEKPSLILGAPSLLSSVLPWDDLPFWFEAHALRERFGGDVRVMPEECRVVALPMSFVHLHKTASRVGTVSGFDLGHFDDLSEKSRCAVDAVVDECSLWEYEGGPSHMEKGEPLRPREVLSLDLRHPPTTTESVSEIECGEGTNGMALWTEWRFGEHVVTTGWREGEIRGWHPGYKQGVYFIPPSQLGASRLWAKTEFKATSGEVHFQFSRTSIPQRWFTDGTKACEFARSLK